MSVVGPARGHVVIFIFVRMCNYPRYSSGIAVNWAVGAVQFYRGDDVEFRFGSLLHWEIIVPLILPMAAAGLVTSLILKELDSVRRCLLHVILSVYRLFFELHFLPCLTQSSDASPQVRKSIAAALEIVGDLLVSHFLFHQPITLLSTVLGAAIICFVILYSTSPPPRPASSVTDNDAAGRKLLAQTS